MKINEKVLKQSVLRMESLFRLHLLGIDVAYLKHVKGMDIDFKVTLSPAKDGIGIKARIKYRPEPDVTDTMVEMIVDPRQGAFDWETKATFNYKDMSVYNPKNQRRGPVGNAPRFVALGG